jgi:hypothetical protein
MSKVEVVSQIKEWLNDNGTPAPSPELKAEATEVTAATQQHASVAKPPSMRFQLLSDWLKQPDPPLRWLIDGWMLVGSRTLAFAQFKAGKTTLVGNTVRSLADGDPFLGEAVTSPLNAGETVVVLDFEMSDIQLKEWMQAQAIQNTDRVVIKPLRGTARSFNILDSKCRSEWAQDLRDVSCKFLIVDCIGPVMSALDLDESNNAQVAKFLRLIDELLIEAGVANCWLIHHMGHDERKPRGASAVLGWCDVTITLSRSGDVSTGQRSISAAGRGVSQKKRNLLYDVPTHRFTLAPATQMSFSVGTSSPAKPKAIDLALQEIVALLQAPAVPQSVKALTQMLNGKFHVNTVRDAALVGVQQGVLVKGGPHNSPTYAVP